MKKNLFVAMVLCVFLGGVTQAVTIAYWDFNDPGAANQAVMPGNASREADISGNGTIGPEDFLISAIDKTGNGNHLSAWTSSWMKWSAESYQGDFAMEATNTVPDSRTDSHWSSPTGIDVESIQPLEWTVECVWYSTAQTNRCMVGRIGQNIRTGDGTTAALYLAERSNARVNCEYVDVSGAYHNAMSADNAIVAGKWYHIAAVSDGTTLTLYLRDLEASETWDVVATADLSGSADPSLIADEYDEANFASNGPSWTVACGTWNGNTTDRFLSPAKIDMAAISDDARAPGSFAYEVGPKAYGPYDPQAIPQNNDGSVGTVNIADLTVTNVDLTFKAAGDPNYPDNGSIVRSDTASFVIRLQTDAPTDPNLYIVDAIPAGSMTDPNRFFELSAYNSAEFPAGILQAGTTYQWQVEQVLMNPLTSLPYANGDPNNILGPVWSFTTVSAVPDILTDPDHTLTDFTGAATLTVEASSVANNYRWYQVVGEQDTSGLVDDIELSDGGIYSGTQTDTLTITGMVSDGSQDAQYYAIAYNGVPGDALTQESGPSAAAWVWYPREVHRYKFETEDFYAADSNSFVADTIGISDIQLMSADTGDDLASIDPNNPNAPELDGTKSLYLNNPNANDPNHVDGQYGQINDPMVVAYKDISIATWIYHKGGGWQRILSIGNNNGSGTGPANNQYLYLCPSANNTSGQLRLEISGQNVTAPAGSVPENEWAYVTATLSGNVAKLYVNGEWVATNDNLTADPIANVPTANNWIGRSQWYVWDTLFNGYIADLRIWNYGLTTDDVAQAYMDDDTNVTYVCESEINDLPYDYNGNCIIDLGDFAIIAATWMDSYRILPN